MTDITLYYAPDNASLIVQIVLEELGLPYESILVDRSKNAQSSKDYLTLNPTGLIPVCVIDGNVVTETAAIVMMLAEKQGSSLIVSPDSGSRSAFLRWLFFLSNTLHADLRQLFYAEKYVAQPDEADYRLRARVRITQSLNILDGQYQTQSHEYLFGTDPTIVDFYLAVCLRWLQLYPLIDRGWLNLKDYPALYTMAGAAQQREAVIRACQHDGIDGDFFTSAADANPSVGSAL